MTGDVIPLAVFREHQATAMQQDERKDARKLLADFKAYRVRCPTAIRETSDVATSEDSSPLRPAELRALRTMMAQFSAIRARCPTARNIVADLADQ